MRDFLNHHAGQVKGVLSGWDRLAFNATLGWFCSLQGLRIFLCARRILFKDFANWAQGLTHRIRQGCDQTALALGIPSIYLPPCAKDKEKRAREIARQRGVDTGPICRFSVLEPCFTPTVTGNRATHNLELALRRSQCVWEYFYFNDPDVGFGHLRLQTWLPFMVKGCLNGRHWLERDLLREGMDYVKADNCFRWVQDAGRAQELLKAQLQTNWPEFFAKRMAIYFPVMANLLGPEGLEYYWTAEETEWATDIMFRDTAALDRLFPLLSRHAMMVADSANVMRFLGQIAADAKLPARATGDIRGDRRRRHEGMRVKHSHGKNSVKMYNKAGNVLRAETTINAPAAFKVFREDAAGGRGDWLAMRKGTADFHRRAQVSQKSNERYLDALSACESEATLLETVAGVCARKRQDKRSARALNPWGAKDHRLLEFLAQGQWAINGLRNRNLALWLEPKAGELDCAGRRCLTARVSRLLRLLRVHGLIRKTPKTHRYQITPKGKEVAALVIAASNVQTKKLMEMAA